MTSRKNLFRFKKYREATIKMLLLASSTSLLFSSPSFSQSLGQLFTSPEERANLDSLRTDFLTRTESEGFDIQGTDTELLDGGEQQNVEFSLEAIIEGIQGKRTIWLNGSAIKETDLPRDVDLIKRQGQDFLRIRTASEAYLLKPGQTLNLETGELVESYEIEDLQDEESVLSSILPSELLDSTIEQVEPENSNTTTLEANAEGGFAIADLIQALQTIQAASENPEQP